ncbi:type II secretion system protein F [Clostridiales bacterium]|nr:type II secretion system protein F [Clostridiales bacterium]
MISNEEISVWCMELSLLLQSGVGVGDALSMLAEKSDKEYQQMFSVMAEKADYGQPISSVMREAGCFPQYVCGLIEVGEQTGHTEEALNALSDYYEERARMGRRVRSALLYPAIMLALMLAVIGVLLVKVLPIFDDVYASLGGRLTGAAAGLLIVGRWLDKAMPFIWILLALATIFIVILFVSKSFRTKALSFWKSRFGDTGVARKLSMARVSQAMAMGMASGMSPEETVVLAAKLEEDSGRERCMNCHERLENGQSLSKALNESGLLPADQCHLLELGQKSGAGDISMSRISRKMTEEGEAALEDLVSRVEPALVLISSILVGLILLSVMLPLMHIMAAMG